MVEKIAIVLEKENLWIDSLFWEEMDRLIGLLVFDIGDYA